jgi:hypothetical protein
MPPLVLGGLGRGATGVRAGTVAATGRGRGNIASIQRAMVSDVFISSSKANASGVPEGIWN